jgi:RNA polymerase sigma factor (sigma-70 family)
MSVPDEHIVQRVREGDTEAFGDLVASHGTPVYRIAVATTGDAGEAEDLTQSCFVQAFTRLGELRDGRRFASWLYAIAHNSCRDWLRKHSRRPVLLGDPSKLRRADPSESASNPESHALAVARDEPVRRAVNSLPPDYREVVVLRYVCGLSYAEIAETMGVKLSAVKMRWHRARKMLQERLRSHLADEIEEACHDLQTG